MTQASVFGILFSSSYPHHPLPTSHFPQVWWPNTTAPKAYPEGHAVLTEEPRFLARRGDRAVIRKMSYLLSQTETLREKIKQR